MAVIQLTSFIKYLKDKESRIIDSPGYNHVGYDVDMSCELFPLFYVNELDKRLEYMNKIAKLMNPYIHYGGWKNNNNRTQFEWEVGFTWANFMPIILDDAGNIDSRQRMRTIVFDSHREYGIPRRIRWFENGST